MLERTIAEYMRMCEWDGARFFVFSGNVFGDLVYYSHILPLLVSLLFAIFVFWKNPRLPATRWLLVTTGLLSVWLLFDLILWATDKPGFTMFFWSIVNMAEPMIYAGALFFMYAFVGGRDMPWKQKLVVFSMLLPTVILAPTDLNLTGYDLTNCWREAAEGLLPYYSYMVELVLTVWILTFGIRSLFSVTDLKEKTKIMLATAGTVFFLLSFAMGNIIGSLLVDWEVGQYGLFGIPVFIALLSYLIVKYNVFDIKLIEAQVLVFALGLLVFSMLFIGSLDSVRIIAMMTIILIAVLGYLLIKGVKREVKQREELTKLNTDLKEILQQRESLVHLITHKVKGSFTRTKYIFAEMLAGSFGELSDEMKRIAEKGLESDIAGVQTIDLVLNASNLESGIVKYDMKKMNLRDVAEKIVAEKIAQAEGKGLRLEADFPEEDYPVVGDVFWLGEAVANLVDNAIKYTREGYIKVALEKKDGKVILSVTDTGVGIIPEDKALLFTEGGRGKDSIKVNVDSTGYGLFSVKLIMDAHGGRVWAESEGAGKGSRFSAEIDLA